MSEERDYLEAVGEVFDKLAGLSRDGKIEEAMDGEPVTVGFRRLT